MKRGRPPYPGPLTPRQLMALRFLKEGLTNEAIAKRMGITANGAKYHVAEILSRLGVKSRGDAVLWSQQSDEPAKKVKVLGVLFLKAMGLIALGVGLILLASLAIGTALMSSRTGNGSPGAILPTAEPSQEAQPCCAPSDPFDNPPAGVTIGQDVPGEFVGTLEGIIFGPKYDSLTPQETSSNCTPVDGQSPMEAGYEPEFLASELRFDVSYVPAGMQRRYIAVSSCKGEVIYANMEFGSGSGGFQVHRRKGPLFVESPMFSQRNLATIGGRSAVVTERAIYMVDAISAWEIILGPPGSGLSVTELLKIAAGIRTP